MLNNLRQHFELARFDHVESINRTHTDSIVDVVECVCASFFGFITFFHSGEYHVHSMKPEVEELNVRIQQQKKEFEKRRESVRLNRSKLERGLCLTALQASPRLASYYFRKDEQFHNKLSDLLFPRKCCATWLGSISFVKLYLQEVISK